MNFGQAISSGFSNYVNFSGRAPRSGFWYWILFWYIAFIIAVIVDFYAFSSLRGQMGPISSLTSLALFLPSLAVSARRLHDIDRTAWWLLLILTLIGSIVLLVWYCMRGTPGPNRFGPDPLAGA